MLKEDLVSAKTLLKEIQEKGYSGYPSIDQPWIKFFVQEELAKTREKRTVYQEVLNNNQQYPKDLALEFFGAKINFAEFFKNVNATAKSFEEYGIKKGDFVTICAAGTPETAYAFYALSKIGAIANMMAPYFDKEQMVNRIADCESDFLIVMDKFYPIIKDSIKKSRIKNIVVLPTMNSSLLRYVTKGLELEKHSNEIFWNQFIRDGKKRAETNIVDYEKDLPLAVVYSSGSTGASKGILLSNDSFQNSIQAYPASGMDVARGQKFYQIIPPWYSTGLSTSIHLPLSYGASVFMDPRFERKIFINNIIKAKPNYTVAPTSMYEGFITEKLKKNQDLSFFNYPFEGGEALRQEVATQIEQVFKEHGSDAKLRVAYGQCECGAAITTQTQKTEKYDGSVGIPLPGVTVSIFDEDFNELPYYERGQILVCTPCSMLEYYKNPEATAKYFYTDEQGRKWNCTGDIGYIDENGDLFVQGRASDFTMVNDKKIYNFDLENIIFNHPKVKMCDVLNKTCDDAQQLVAHIILEDNFAEQTKSQPELIENVLKEIQKMIYEQFGDLDFVPTIFKIRDSFPHHPSGKRDIAAIKNETEGFITIPKNHLKIKKLELKN